jgi:hypothetical protein
MPSLVAVGHLRLRGEPFFEPGVAIASMVMLGAAAIILEELRVRFVSTPLPVLLRLIW